MLCNSCMNCAHISGEFSRSSRGANQRPGARHLIATPPRRPLRNEAFPSEPSTGALLALPPPVRTPKRSKCFFMMSALKCFVAMSAGLSAPATFSKPSSLRFTWSCTQTYRTFRCRSFPNPALRTIPIAALASVWMVTLTATPKSLSKDIIPRPCAAPLVSA